MTLIAIVLALILERILSYSPAWRTHDLTWRWMQWLDGRFGVGAWSLALYLLVPVSLVAGLDWWLAHKPLGVIMQLPLFLLVLVACIGPRDLHLQVQAYREAVQSNDEAAAERILRNLVTGPLRASAGESLQRRSPVAACFVQGHERWIGVLFWFFALGAAGAVAYSVLRSVTYHLRVDAGSSENLRLADWLHGAMAWPSSRITVLCYALAGSADQVFAHWRQWTAEDHGGWVRDSWALLASSGLAAMAQDPSDPDTELDCMEAALRLLDRSVMIILAFVALLTAGGWLS